jgi:predicted CXXCH cytochrome family protein
MNADARLKPSRHDDSTPDARAGDRWSATASAARLLCVLPCALLVVLVGARASYAQAPPSGNSCIACHSTQTDQRLANPTRLFAGQDVHRDKGFECVDCHGGSPASAEKAAAHDASGRFAAMAFRGKPTGQAVIATCARCHSDAELMRSFAPKQRVDQATEYAASVHGKQLAAGDTKVATCASCHGAHGIRLVSDAKSPVFPTNVANTCASCHADQKRMDGYKLPDGSPLPTHQFADYQKSVHYAALTKGNDLSAPTCNDCHGNHGAAPPNVGAVANVCGTCHAVFAQKFSTSVHQPIFDKGCVECHSNHAVAKPSDQMLSATAPGVCQPCHSGDDKTDRGAAAAAGMRGEIEQLKHGIEQSSGLMAHLKNAGIEVSDQQLALREAGTKLTLARTEVHGFDPTKVTPILADGMKIVSTVDRAGQSGTTELRFRRRGLFLSLGTILIFVVALALKVRQIDRRDHERRPPATV